MNVLMISINDMSSDQSLGVSKKISGQYKAFQSLGCNTYNICLNNGEGILIHGSKQKVISSKKVKSYFTVIDLFDKAPTICKKLNIDFCYIRYTLADWSFMRMVRRLHKICKVVVEIPTYPYDEQNKNLTNIISRFNMFQDKRFRNTIHKYVDRIATFSSDDTIYGTKCINISNGIDVDSVKYLGDSLVYEDTINLIGVAKIQRDHGYDRVIKGLHNYYSSNCVLNPVFFHIVGNGDAENELRDLVKKNSLDKYVIFHGTKFDEELNECYLECQLGVGILGNSRSGMKYTSALKNKEYCAIGLPFISSAIDNAIPENEEYYKLFPSTEEPIDIGEVIDYFNFIKHHREINKEMRAFAEKELSWVKQIKIILDEVKDIC